MERHILLARTNATTGTDDEFNDWYDNVHLKEVLAVPGFVSAQRFVEEYNPHSDAEPQYRYLAIYEVEGVTPQQAYAALKAAIPGMDITENLDPVREVLFFAPVTDRRT